MKVLKLLAPHLLAVIVFFVVSFLYFPPLLEGKVIRQGDIVHFQGMSKEISDFRAATGKEPLWTNSMFGGMPAYQISVVYHHNVAKNINNILTLKLPVPAVFLFLALIGFYILMLVLGANVWIAVAGAFAYAFSSYFFIIEAAGHNSKAHAMTFMAPILAGVILTFRGKYILGAAVFALFLALQLNANHLQITYYTALIIIIYGIVELVSALKEKKLLHFSKATSILAAVALVAAFTNITNMLLTYEYGKESTRGKSELTINAADQTSGLDKSYILNNYSYGIGETFNLFIPNFKGGGTSDVGTNSESFKWLQENNYNAAQAVKHMPTYWGEQYFTSGPVYIGAVVIFLFVLGLFLIRGPFKWWIVAATALSILLAWGKNLEWFSTLFIDYFPGYNKFRTVSMTLVIAELTIPVLAMVAFIKILKGDFDKKVLNKYLLYSLYITGGFALIFVIIPGLFFSFTSSSDTRMDPGLVRALISDRESLLRADAFRSLVFVVLAAGLIWFIMKNKIKPVWACIVLTALFLLDLGTVGKRYLNEDNFVSKRESKQPYIATEADLAILQDKDLNFRVINLTTDPFNDASTSYFHKSIGGYHGAKLKRYQELIENQISKNNIQVLNMLNTKYFIVAGENQQPVPQLNPEALGNAWFVDSILLVPNADAEISALTNLNPKTKVIVDKRFETLLAKKYLTDSLSSIKLTEYQPNYLVYQSNTSSDQLAVFSEIYYQKGWNAFVDGKLTPHFRANYVLRAMQIPAGNHKVEFKFEPQSYKTGESISLASSVILMLLLISAFGYELFRVYKKEENSGS